MNHAEKQEAVARANARRGAISDAKGPEYAGQADAYKADDSDVLANFKRQDVRWGYDGSGLSSAFLYFGKHLDSIETYAREVKALLAAGDIDGAHALGLKGEGIVSRLDDARNYIDLIECLMLDALVHEDKTPVSYTLGTRIPAGYKESSKPGVFIREDTQEVGSDAIVVLRDDECSCEACGDASYT